LEFNTLTLQPTYRLLWGSAGSSNALDIATALGFDPAVLADARILARAELGRQEEQLGRMEQVRERSADTVTAGCGKGCEALIGEADARTLAA
jgi:DNA mismatch repair protein MutS2